MRPMAIGLLLSALLSASAASARDAHDSDAYDSRRLFASPMFVKPAPATGYDAYDPRNCNGAEWDDNNALVVSKVTASPRVNFVKSPYDDDFKAATCPSASAACRKRSYLVPGDLVLIGKTRDGFTCVSHPPLSAEKPVWTNGWLPSSALTPVAPMPSPDVADWLGSWTQPHGTIEIKRGGLGGRLQIQGEMVVPTARDFHTGIIDAQVNPAKDTLAILNDGWFPFETQCDSGCRVRMQRVGPFLKVEDDGDCGGAGVSFTGLYRRQP
jgi:hypothetical protein